MDPDTTKMASGLVRPEGAFDTILRTGVVVAVGPGTVAKKGDRYLDKTIPTGLEPGDGVVFNRVVASMTKTAEALHQAVLSKDECLIRPNDVMLVYDRKEPVRFE
jgi:co-chaperonin GroES (HSP10)